MTCTEIRMMKMGFITPPITSSFWWTEDHSGGRYLIDERRSSSGGRNNGQAQYYEIKSEAEQDQRLVSLPFIAGSGMSWMIEEPYALGYRHGSRRKPDLLDRRVLHHGL